MKKISGILFLIVTVALSSCINSLNPLITHKNIESFDAASGSWTDEEGNHIKIEKFRNSNLEREFNMQQKKSPGGKDPKPLPVEEVKYLSNIYLVSYSKNSIEHYMILSFTRMNGHLFAQLEPLLAVEEHKKVYDPVLKMERDPAPTSVWELGTSHTYSFAKVNITNAELRFVPIDGDYLDGLLEKGMMAVPFEKDDLFGSTFITASTEQLQKFFFKYGNDEKIFNKKYTLVLKPNAL